MSNIINPQTGLDQDPVKPLYFDTKEEYTPLSFGDEQVDMRDIQLGNLGVGQYSRDENLDFGRVSENPQDLNYQRADLQTGWELLGKSLAQGAIEATVGAAEGIAYALDFEELYNHDKQAQEGFDNWASKGIREFKEGLQEDYFKIYQTEDAEQGNLWDKMGDGTWWASQGKTMGTTLSLMFPAMGVAGIASKAGKAIGIANAAVEAGLSGTAAALFSRKAESAMEANQKWQEESQNPEALSKIQAEVTSEINSQAQSLIDQYDKISSTLNNPALENYQQLEAEKANQLFQIENQIKQLQQTTDQEIDRRMKVRAGEIASKVFKGNAAMLPVDALQYALLLKPLSGLKKTADALGKSVLGKTASTLAIQPGSEALEEGYQFVVGEEAVHSVDEDSKMFGSGFGDRMSEYVKDPTFHEAIFLGGAMGLLFEGAGPTVKKLADKTSKVANVLSSKQVAQDPNKVKKIIDEDRGSFVSRSLINDNVDRNISELEKFVEDIDNKGYTEEEKQETLNNYKTLISDLNDVKKWDSELIADDRYSENTQLRNQYTIAKLEAKHVADNISKYTNEYNTEFGKIGSEVILPELTPAPNSNAGEVNNLRSELIEAIAYKNSLENVIKTTNNSTKKEIDDNHRVALIKSLEPKLKAAEIVVEEKTKELKSKSTNFSKDKLAASNIEKIQTARNYLTENTSKNEFITTPTLAHFQNLNKDKAKTEEKKVVDEIKKEVSKVVNEEVSKKAQASTNVEELKNIKSAVEETPEINKETKSVVENKLKEEIVNKEVGDITQESNIAEKVDLTNVPEGIEGTFDFESTDEKIHHSEPIVDIEDKKADIERRRQEELIQFSPGLNKKIKEEVLKALNNNDVVEFKKLTGSRNGFSYKIKDNAKINAKYDAELAALEDVEQNQQSPEISDVISEEINISDNIVVDTFESKTKDVDPKIVFQPLPHEQIEDEVEDIVEKIGDDKSVAIARTKEYEVDDSGKKQDSYDEKGNLIILKENLSSLDNAIPDKFAVGKTVVLTIDQNFLNKGSNNTKDYLPIAIQTVEDYNNGVKPTLWVRAGNNANKSDKAIRKHLFDLVNKNKKPNYKVTLETTIVSHNPAIENRTKDVRPLLEQNIDGVNDLAHLFVSNFGLDLITKDNNGDYIKAEYKGNKFSGVAYVGIKNSDGKWRASRINQVPISDERFDSIRKEWIDATFAMVINHALKLGTFDDINHLKYEVGKYFNLNDSLSEKTAVPVAKEEGQYNNFFGIRQNPDGEIILQLPGKMKDGIAYPYQQYTITNRKGKLLIQKYGVDGIIELNELRNDFNSKLQNMYPNITNIEDVNLRNNFTRLKIDKNFDLVETEPMHYYKFLSDNKIAMTRIHGLKTPTGNIVFGTNPVIEINSNVDSFTEVGSKKTVEQKTNIEINTDDADVSLPPLPTEDLGIDNDMDFSDLEDASSYLPLNQIDFNRTTLESFAANNDIVQSILTNVLSVLDQQKELTGSNNFDTALATVKLKLESLRNNLNKFTTSNLTPEEAKLNKVSTSAALNKKIANELTSVLENFKEVLNPDNTIKFIGYEDLVRKQFDSLSFNSLIEAEEDFEEGGEGGESFAENKSMKTDPEKSMSARVRRLFYNVPVRNSEGKIISNSIGQAKYMDSGVVFNYLIDQLVNTPANDILDELRALAEDNYIAKDVLTKLDLLAKSKPDVVNNFVVTMRKQEANFRTLKYIFPKENQTLPTIQIIHTNRTGVTDNIQVEWNEKFVASLHSKNAITEDGNIDKTFAKQLVDKYKSIENKELKQSFLSTLKLIGIDFNPKAYDKLLKDFGKKNNAFVKRFGSDAQTSSFKDFLDKSIGVIFTNSLAKGYNPYSEQEVSIKNLAFYQAKFEQDATSRMFKNSNGDNIYGYVNPSHLSNTISELVSNKDKVAELMKDPFSSKSTILRDISRYQELSSLDQLTVNEEEELKKLNNKIKNVGISYFDASKNDVGGTIARSYEKQSVAEKELTKLALFINNNANYALMFTPTPSDKTTFPLLQVNKINTRSITYSDGKLRPSKSPKFHSEINPLFEDLTSLLIQSEVDRINSVSKLFTEAKESNDFNHLVEGFHYIKTDKGLVPGAGSYFFMIPEMNQVVLDNNIRNLETGELTIDKLDSKLITKVLQSGIEELVEAKLKQWNEFGITKEGKFNSVDKSVLNTYNNPSNLAVSYVVNTMSALANEYMLVTNDPAKFGKVKGFDGSYSNYNTILEQTQSNMFKRIAKDIAPGLEGKWDETNYSILMINDPVVNGEASKYSDKLKKAFSNIELADAQEWTTLKEHLNVLKAYGRITNEDYNDILNNQDNLNQAQLRTILQPMKPVQVLNKFESDLKSNIPYYIKTSSFPLIQQLTKNFPQLDRMRLIMEGNSIDRMMPKTAVKTGFRNSVNIEDLSQFKEDGITLKNNKVIQLDRSGFKIQQDVPFDIKKEKILEASQFRKLITANLLKTPEKALKFDFNGIEVDGIDLKDLNDAIHVELYRRKFDSLLKKLGAVETESGIDLLDVNKLRDMLIEEAISKDYGVNEILALKTMNFDGRTIFETPLYFHPMIHKIESLLTSLIKNKVLVNKFPGKSYVQGSSYGFKATTEEFLKEFGSTDGIVYSKDFNPEKGLHYVKNADGSIEAEVFIPIPFKKTVNGNKVPVDINDYTKDGYIDLSKIDPKMLEMIGYRIPTQKYSSMIKLKIAGFLPESSGDLIIIPPEMSAQMGSDFDVDKLYIHWFNYEVSDDNNIRKVNSNKDVDNLEVLTDEELQNISLDIAHSILKNKDIADQTTTPLDNKDIANVIDKIEVIRPSKRSSNKMSLSVVNDNLHSEMVDIQSAGKVGVAVESTATTMHALGQYAGLYINGNDSFSTSVKFSKKRGLAEFNDFESVKKDGFNPISNTINKNIEYDRPQLEGAWRLDKIFGFSGKMISDVLTNLQTEAVDNANNRRLHPMNLNGNTFDVANLIARTGFDEEFIGFFLNQPIILEYVEELNKLSRYDEKDFTPNKKEFLQLRLFNKLGLKLEFGQLNDIPTENLSMEEMSEGISTNGKDKAIQLKALQNFIVYDRISKDLNVVQRTANVDNKYLGSNLNGVVAKLNSFSKDVNGQFIGNGHKLHGDIEETTQGSAFTIGIKKSIDLYKNILPLNAPFINDLLKRFTDTVNRELREEELLDLNIGIRSAVYNEAIKGVFGIDNIDEYRSNLLHGKNSLGNRVSEFKKKDNAPLFIRSLRVNYPVKSGEPITITHVSSKTNKSELDYQKQLDWLRLLNSPKDSVEYKLGFDLMVYSITFGTQRTANDFGRFLPDDFVKQSGLAEFLRGINFFNPSENQVVDDLTDNFYIQFVQHNTKFASSVNDENLKKLDDGKFELDSKSLPYIIKTFNEETYETTLYKKFKDNVYEKIDKLGIGDLTEYNISTKYGKSKSNLRDESKNNVKKTYLAEKQANSLLNKFEFKKGSISVLENIANKATKDSYKELAKFFLKHSNIISQFTLEEYNPNDPRHFKQDSLADIKGKVDWKERLIAINTSGIESQVDLEHTFLHEFTHAYTSTLNANRALLTNEQKDLFDKLDGLIEFAKKSDVDNKYTYRLSNTDEFISAVMTHKSFQEFLNGINYKKSNLLTEILNFFRKLIGIDVKENSILAHSIDSVIKIVESTSNEQFDQVYKEANLIDLISDDLNEADEIKKECSGGVKNTVKKGKIK